MKSPISSVLVVAVIIGGCASAPPPKPMVATVPEKPVEAVAEAKPLPKLPTAYTQKGVMVKLDSLWQGPNGEILGVSGTAKNVTASDLKFCSVSLAFMDADGAKVDDAKASTKTLKSAQTWHFQAALTHPSPAGYATITPDKTVAIPVKPKADLASLQ